MGSGAGDVGDKKLSGAESEYTPDEPACHESPAIPHHPESPDTARPGPDGNGHSDKRDGLGERRRNAVLAGYRPGDDPEAWSDDPDPGIRALAVGALFRAGRFGPDTAARALDDPDAVVRRRGATLAGHDLSASSRHADVLIPLLIDALGDPDPLVAEAVAWALGETGDETAADVAVDALCDVAAGHDDPLVRESAVAALGAIGAPRSLDVVLDALDGPPALRRRAAVALAAFDDRRAAAGLARCLDDRDWLVRQAAEELLRTD